MKKSMATLLTLVLLLSLAACGKPAPAEPQDTAQTEKQEIVVFAAASMTETLTKLGDLYMQKNDGVKLTFNFDSSGTLKTQIQEGADCDLFISAAQKQMNQLDATADKEANPDGLDFVLLDTRVNLLENKVVLVAPEGNPSNISSFADLEKAKLIALGNSDVPVGSYSLKILDYLGLDIKKMEADGRVTYGSNVKEVTTQVSEGTVDCGIVYATDAFSAGLTVVDTATTEMCGQAIYPAAVLNVAKNQEGAKEFLTFLQTKEAMSVFEEVGFTAVQ